MQSSWVWGNKYADLSTLPFLFVFLKRRTWFIPLFPFYWKRECKMDKRYPREISASAVAMGNQRDLESSWKRWVVLGMSGGKKCPFVPSREEFISKMSPRKLGLSFSKQLKHGHEFSFRTDFSRVLFSFFSFVLPFSAWMSVFAECVRLEDMERTTGGEPVF